MGGIAGPFRSACISWMRSRMPLAVKLSVLSSMKAMRGFSSRSTRCEKSGGNVDHGLDEAGPQIGHGVGQVAVFVDA